ncbi:hypothetical protein EsH8_V_001013 [Colletotrichum jinshuiense]
MDERQRLILGSVIIPGLLLVAAWRWLRVSEIPTINAYRGDFTLKRAHAQYLQNAKGLIAEGIAKFNGPFRVVTTLGSRVILPSSFTEWVRTCDDLDHPKLVADEYFAYYPGFEGNKVVVDPSRMMINVTKTKLAQSSQCELFNETISEMLEEEWADAKDWKTVKWGEDAPRFVGRMSAAVFVGPQLARDPEWQKLTLTYTLNLFNSIRALRGWPWLLRPIVHWFLSECRTCRDQVKVARNILTSVLEKRARDKKEALDAGRTPVVHQDTITWMQEQAKGRPFDPAATQLAFAISAMHTTSELLRQVLLDICMHPELIQPLKDEIATAVEESGWTTAGVFKMQLLDSVIKETQRLKPGSLVNLERKALRDIRMPNGMLLPKGTNIAVDTSEMWNPSTYENPEKYDGYRFFNMRQKGGPTASTAQLVSATSDHIAFGLGKPVCPGRFFVAHEVKVALANILTKYDVRLPKGRSPKVIHYGFEMLSDPTAEIEVRKQKS